MLQNSGGSHPDGTQTAVTQQPGEHPGRGGPMGVAVPQQGTETWRLPRGQDAHGTYEKHPLKVLWTGLHAGPWKGIPKVFPERVFSSAEATTLFII